MYHNRPQQRAPSPHMFRSRSTTSPGTRTSITPEPKPSHPHLVGRSKSSRATTSTNPSHYPSVSSNVNYNKATTSSGSKSAWALSPGRSFAPPPPPDHSRIKKTPVQKKTDYSTKTIRGGVSGVLKYFKSKKASPKEQEEFHSYKLLHNRLVQWRFTNAKAEASMASIKAHAESKLFSVWLQVLKLRNMVMEKRLLVQRDQHMTKLLEIVNPQMGLLDEWMRIEKRNFEALNRMTRKLCTISTQLPLIAGAEGDVQTVYDVMKMAIDTLESVEENIPKLLHQVEMSYRLLEELIDTAEHERECVEELSHLISDVSSLEVAERCSKICLIQTIEDTMYL